MASRDASPMVSCDALPLASAELVQKPGRVVRFQPHYCQQIGDWILPVWLGHMAVHAEWLRNRAGDTPAPVERQERILENVLEVAPDFERRSAIRACQGRHCPRGVRPVDPARAFMTKAGYTY